jgi:Sec-independent protein translocase protein TatA
MNFLGVGPAEIIVIIVLMLVVAGPKRMIQWAYHAGRYTAMMRQMFQETMSQITREFEDSGIDVRKDLPQLRSKFDIVGEASRVINADLKGEPTSTATPPGEIANSSPTTQSSTSSSMPDAKDDENPRYDAWTPS